MMDEGEFGGNDDEPVEFQWYDYFLFAVILLISTVIGLYFALSGGKQNSTKEYLSANRTLGILPSLLSIYMSQTSGVAIVGHPAEMYTYGIQALWILLGNTLGYVLGAVLFVPLFYPLKLTSSFEYLEMRFKSKAVRQTATVLSLIGGILYLGISLFTPGVSLDAVTPIPMWASYLAVGVLGTIYTALGGLKAVVWTDVFQAFSTLAGLVAVCVLSVKTVGSFGEVWDLNKEGGRIWHTFDPNPLIRMSFWSVVFGNFVNAVQVTGTHQTTVQRVCAMKSLRDAYLATIGIIPVQFGLYILVFTCGGAAFAYYHALGCDPLRSGQINNVNQLLPYFISHGIRKAAIPGLFVAILFSAGISSVTSTMNSMAAVTWKDFMEDRPLFKKLPESRKALITKLLALLFGIIGIGFAFAYQYFPGNAVMAIQSINTASSSPILGIFILGAMFPFTNWIGGLVGMIVGFAMNFTLGMGNAVYGPYALSLNTTVHNCSENATVSDFPILGNEDSTPGFFRMSHTWYAAVGTAATVIVGLLVSLITGPEKACDQNPDYIIPFFDRLFCCCPVNCRRKFWCNVNHIHPIEDNDQHEESKEEKDDHLEGEVINSEKSDLPCENVKMQDSLSKLEYNSNGITNIRAGHKPLELKEETSSNHKDGSFNEGYISDSTYM